MAWCSRRDDDFTVPNGSQSSDGCPSSGGWIDWELGRDVSLVRADILSTKNMKGADTASSFDGASLYGDLKPSSCLQGAKGFNDRSAYGDLLFSDLPDHPLQSSLERMDFWDCGYIGEMLPFEENPLDSSDDAYTSTSFGNFSTDKQGLTKSTEVATSEKAATRSQEKGASLEAKILQDLEGVVSQMDSKTRICFRDAMYRLAENKTRSCGASYVERETNAVDRAVASMMFSNVVCPPPPPF